MTHENYKLISALESRIEKLESAVKALKEPKKAFQPPTVEMVKAYCKERGNTVDAEQFVDFYTTKNWMVGKNKMKVWESAVRTWEKSGQKPESLGTNLGSKPIPKDYGIPSETATTMPESLRNRINQIGLE